MRASHDSGHTSQLTNSAGTITDRYAYDVFGALRSQSGTTANDWRYTGQQSDYNANRGLYFLRARSYDPSLGRFLQRDPLPFVQRYAYAKGNPASLIDPSGLYPGEHYVNTAKRTWNGVVDTSQNAMDKALDGDLGYVDLNLTGCLPIRFNVGPCGTIGLQWQIGTREIRPYAGGGVGSGGLSFSATVAPFQRIARGWSCGAQFTEGGFTYNFGHPLTHYEEWGFAEFGAGIGTGASSVCYYVF